jgi:hypothetical protein
MDSLETAAHRWNGEAAWHGAVAFDGGGGALGGRQQRDRVLRLRERERKVRHCPP